MKALLCLSIAFSPLIVFAQKEHEPSQLHPYGTPNPEAPAQISDFAPMIGLCNCISKARINKDSWADDQEMTWEFKYIMNGMAIQDETFKPDGIHSGSIRQFHPDSLKWYVNYYSVGFNPKNASLWTGGKEGGNIVLYQNQKAPNGMEGYSRLTFFDISDAGFKWISEWVDPTETFTYPTWKIDCVKAR